MPPKHAAHAVSAVDARGGHGPEWCAAAGALFCAHALLDPAFASEAAAGLPLAAAARIGPTFFRADTVSYDAYLGSAFFDHDLDFTNESERWGWTARSCSKAGRRLAAARAGRGSAGRCHPRPARACRWRSRCPCTASSARVRRTASTARRCPWSSTVRWWRRAPWARTGATIPASALVPGENRLCFRFSRALPGEEGTRVAAAVSVIQLP
jgi:hypothetical protein